jgi:hypothetical protein
VPQTGEKRADRRMPLDAPVSSFRLPKLSSIFES